jgi:hypothetical protein
MKVQIQLNCRCTRFTAYDLKKLIDLHSLSDLTDANVFMESLDPTLFPGVNSSVEVHSGFADEHALTASIILKEVKSLISQYNANSVTLVSIEHFVTTLK